jgi:hypothetical protein
MAWDANDAARARGIVPLSRQRQSPTLSKKVTSLLLFTAEKFAAVDDKLTKKTLFSRGRAVFSKKCGSLAFVASSLQGSLRCL